MKPIVATIILLLTMSASISAQDEIRPLPSFNKIIVSPRISLVLIKGDKESIRLLCNNISPEKVNVRIHGNKLQLYLDHARYLEKQVRAANGSWKQGIYSDVTVTAYVTYRSLKALEIRGQSEISADDELVADKLKLRAFGECEINFASIDVQKFKASLYGENKLTIGSGLANRQVFRIFGQSTIRAKGLVCATASVRMFGEGKLSINATDEVALTAFGEPHLALTGNAILSQVVVGEGSVSRDR